MARDIKITRITTTHFNYEIVDMDLLLDPAGVGRGGGLGLDRRPQERGDGV